MFQNGKLQIFISNIWNRTFDQFWNFLLESRNLLKLTFSCKQFHWGLIKFFQWEDGLLKNSWLAVHGPLVDLANYLPVRQSFLLRLMHKNVLRTLYRTKQVYVSATQLRDPQPHFPKEMIEYDWTSRQMRDSAAYSTSNTLKGIASPFNRFQRAIGITTCRYFLCAP